VNYRGSTGFGRDSIDALTGTIGTTDVSDMVACTRDVIDTMTWASLGLPGAGKVADGARVGVVGGSHGGFLSAHLIGQVRVRVAPLLFAVA
jgi:acylaminoacyl-peptidase